LCCRDSDGTPRTVSQVSTAVEVAI
jgi:hypothetical protein